MILIRSRNNYMKSLSKENLNYNKRTRNVCIAFTFFLMNRFQLMYNLDEKYKEELSRLGEKIIQIEQYNQSILDNIALKRRQTFKTEEEMINLEKEKKSQDFLIDKLTQQTNLLYSQIANLDIQINQQKSETKTAQDVLAEALTEIDAIKFEKKQLQQQWNSSLIGMQRRDEAL